jgi:hypothetical protein
MGKNCIFEIYASFPIDKYVFESNLDFDQNRPKCLMYSSGKFAIFGQNLTRVEKTVENREKYTKSKELIFRFLKLNFRVEITISKL